MPWAVQRIGVGRGRRCPFLVMPGIGHFRRSLSEHQTARKWPQTFWTDWPVVIALASSDKFKGLPGMNMRHIANTPGTALE